MRGPGPARGPDPDPNPDPAPGLALNDAVAQQYQRWVYPEPIVDLPGWLEHNWQWFDPSHAHRLFWPDRDYPSGLDILVAGCGTNQAAVFASTNPTARVVAIDVSAASLEHHRWLQQTYALSNLELHRLPIEQVGTLGRQFDLVVCTGVLHHLQNPVLGLQALAACLRPQGVAALMLYARYGRMGVEMLQGVFRDLGLRQDAESLAVVQAAIAQLPEDHPLRSYMTIAPDLGYDAGLVDTFLHGRDRSYTVADCLELVTSAGLVFQDWFLKSAYEPVAASGDPFLDAVAALPRQQRWAVMERIQHRNGCHFFMACPPERPLHTYRLASATALGLETVPFFRYRCGLEGGMVVRPGWSLELVAEQRSLLEQVDGCRSLGQIIDTVAGELDPAAPGCSRAAVERYARTLFDALEKRDVLAWGLTSGHDSTTSLDYIAAP